MKGKQKILALVLAGAMALLFRYMMVQMDLNQWRKAYGQLSQTDQIVIKTDKEQEEITDKEQIDAIRSVLIREDQVQDPNLKAALLKHGDQKLMTVEYYYQGNKILTEQIFAFVPEGEDAERFAPYGSPEGEIFFAEAKKQVLLLDFSEENLPQQLEKAKTMNLQTKTWNIGIIREIIAI